MGIENILYTGIVYHKRFLPRAHVLKHRVFFIKFPLEEVAGLKNFLFSIDRWNLLSFWHRDHGYRSGSDLKEWACKKLQDAGIEKTPTHITLMTFPRVLGYVFNPVSFWFCYDKDQLIATIAEVNNTFGSTETYVVDSEEKIYAKKFHVSPFFKVEGYYRFRFDFLEKNKIFVAIDYFKEDVCWLKTYITGQPQDLTVKNVFKVWLSHPLMTIAIVFLIHWHALRLYLKKIPFVGTKGV